MKKEIKLTVMTAALVAAAGSFSIANAANEPAKSAVGTTGVMAGKSESNWSDRSRRDSYMGEKDRLEETLAGASSRDEYRQILEKEGYQITSINVDEEDELEYEIVKGADTYEVQLEFDGKPVAESIGVSTNIYKAEATEKALSDKDYKVSDIRYNKATGMKYRDNQYTAQNLDEKEKLEKMLVSGKPIGEYKTMLEKEGWTITSVNDREADEAEYEIVKGKTSYEVEFDIDSEKKLVEEVGVSTNIWQSKETEQALSKQ